MFFTTVEHLYYLYKSEDLTLKKTIISNPSSPLNWVNLSILNINSRKISIVHRANTILLFEDLFQGKASRLSWLILHCAD